MLVSVLSACGSAPQDSWRLAPAPDSPVAGLPKVNGLALADFNGDGLLDIAAVNGDPGQLLILINQGEHFAPFQGEGRFVEFPGGIIPVGSSASGIAIGDLDGNESSDIVISHHDSNEVAVILSNGDGTFEPVRQAAVAERIEPAPHAHNLALADLNNDGDLDIVVAQADANAIIAALGDGAGGFRPLMTAFPAGRHPYTVVVADFNNDGRNDVAAPNADSNDLTIGLGDGPGGFTAPAGARTPLPARTLALAAGDVNADGVIDLVGSADAVQNELSLMLGDGTGGFARSAHAFTAPSRVYGHMIADINQDGMMDVIAPSIDRSSIIIWLADEPVAMRFRRVEFETPGTDSQVLAIGDINGDGILDVVTAGWGQATITVMLGQARQ